MFKKHFYVVVNQATAYKINYLRYGGAFSINKNSRNMLESLDYAAKILDALAILCCCFRKASFFQTLWRMYALKKAYCVLLSKLPVNTSWYLRPHLYSFTNIESKHQRIFKK
jgi:hypothetical protein